MNLYNVTKGQLIIIWIAGIWATLLSLAMTFDASDPYPDGYLVVFIPLALIFYTIGWRRNKKLVK